MSTSELGKWIDQVFNDIFYQPDDERTLKTYQENVSPDLKFRFNGKSLGPDEWKNVILDARAKNTLRVKTNKELLASDTSVAHISTFVLTDKETGVETEATSVTISTVTTENGERVLTDLAEILK